MLTVKRYNLKWRAGLIASLASIVFYVGTFICIIEPVKTFSSFSHFQNIGRGRPFPSRSSVRLTIDEETHDNETRKSNIRTRLTNLITDAKLQFKRKIKPISLALFTVAITSSSRFNPSSSSDGHISTPSHLFHPPAAHASTPLTLVKKFKPPKQKEETMRRFKEAQDEERMKEAMAHKNKLAEIEVKFGIEAREKYEKMYEAAQARKAEEKAIKRKELMYNLAEQGMCPFTDVEGVRQMYLFDHNIDLTFVPTTPQNSEIKLLRSQPGLAKLRAKQRFIVKCIVDDITLRGKDPVQFLYARKDSIAKIYSMRDKEIDPLVDKYKELIQSRGSISGVIAEKPFTKPSAENKVQDNVDNQKVKASDVKARQHQEKKAQEAAKAQARDAAKVLEKQKKEQMKKEKEAAKIAEMKKKEDAKRVKEEMRRSVEASKKSAALSDKPDVYEDVDEDFMDDDVLLDDDESEELNAVPKKETPVEQKNVPTAEDKTSFRIGVIPGATLVGAGVGGVYAVKTIKEKRSLAEKERQRQFKLIMGIEEQDDDSRKVKIDDDDDDDIIAGLSDFIDSSARDSDKDIVVTSAAEEDKKDTSFIASSSTSTQTENTKKRRRMGGISSIFTKKSSDFRETDLNKLLSEDSTSPDFALLIAKLLTYGAPGRFPLVSAIPGGMPMDTFQLDQAREVLIAARENSGLTNEEAAELFASVVNSMIIDIIDLASSSLGAKDKKDKATVDALNVVMDFMDHAASLFDSVAEGVVITPVTYGGALSKSKLEQMFSTYAASMLTNMDGKVTQDRIDTLQMVFKISDKKAEGLIQKNLLKNLMSLMKNRGEGSEGMEGLSAMLAGMGGGGEGLTGLGADGDISPEELKQSINMMKDLVESGSVSKEEIDLVRKQFKDVYGSDISDLIKAAEQDGPNELGEDGEELISLFKTILKEK